MDRVSIFIDGSNFYHLLKEARFRTDIDFEKLAEELTGKDRRHVHTYYYNAPLKNPGPQDPNHAQKKKAFDGQRKFYEGLRYVPDLTARMGRLQKKHIAAKTLKCAACGADVVEPARTAYTEKGVDIMLATDMVVHAMKDHYDTAILLSTDADYKHAVELVKQETGKRVELHKTPTAKAYDLVTACSACKDIDEALIKRCVKKSR